jgi:hypothetical protein
MSAQLRWRGVPVPYIAAWSEEKERYVSEDNNAGGKLAVFRTGRRGGGEPLFGKMDEARQREAVARRRCQVCRAKLDGEPSIALDINYNAVKDGNPVIQEPPVCRPCARLALTLCPGNRRRREHGELLSFEVYEYTILMQLLGPHYGPECDEAFNELVADCWPVVGYLKAVLTRFKPVSIEEILQW